MEHLGRDIVNLDRDGRLENDCLELKHNPKIGKSPVNDGKPSIWVNYNDLTATEAWNHC